MTLFEGGRVYGADVISELIFELHASVAMSEGFEGEMKTLANYARCVLLQQYCIITAVVLLIGRLLLLRHATR